MSKMLRFDPATWERRLATKHRLRLEPKRSIAIKRDVREFTVSVPGAAFVGAFESVMADPSRQFGGIRIYRPALRQGTPFVIGDRFQGCFPLRAFAPSQATARATPGSHGFIPPASSLDHVVRKLENWFTSDYGEIVDLCTTLPARIRYVYLEGSAMAGSSTFEVDALGSELCRVRQVWEYQELGPHLLLPFATVVLRVHLGVVESQVLQAAELAGGTVIESDIPVEYSKRTLPTTRSRAVSPAE